MLRVAPVYSPQLYYLWSIYEVGTRNLMTAWCFPFTVNALSTKRRFAAVAGLYFLLICKSKGDWNRSSTNLACCHINSTRGCFPFVTVVSTIMVMRATNLAFWTSFCVSQETCMAFNTVVNHLNGFVSGPETAVHFLLQFCLFCAQLNWILSHLKSLAPWGWNIPSSWNF